MITKEQEKLFNFVRMALGAPIVLVQLTDDMLCSLMEYTVQEYQSRIAQFLSIQNWAQLYGKNIGAGGVNPINNNEIAWAIMHRNFDYAKQFSYFFSKEVGLQNTGPWELKKDYFLIEKGKQSYVIPAGRTINSVLYVTPNTTDPALVSGVGGFGGGDGSMMGGAGMGAGMMGMGMGMMGTAGGMGGARFGMGGIGGMFMMPAYDFTLLAADLNLKQKLVGNELVYKVTAMASGEHIIHLISTPGAKYWNSLFHGRTQCACWYTYYDTSNGGADDCAKLNTDVLLSPDQYPVTVHSFEFMSPMSQQSVQTLLLAKAKQTLGYIRGYASGEVKIDDAVMKLDYNMLIQDGKSEWEKEMENINKWLEHLHPRNQLKYQQEMIESMYKILSGTPLPIMVM